MFKKFLSVITAVYVAIFGMGVFVGCGNVDTPKNKPQEETYYMYDAQSDEYEDDDYMTLTDTAVVWRHSDVALNEMEFKGNVIFTGDKFSMTLEGSFSVLDTCTVLYRGQRESDGVLRIDNTVITMYSDLVEGPIVTTDNEVMYYCKKGSKPDNPVLPDPDSPKPDFPKPSVQHTVTIDGNGGSFNGEKTITAVTDQYGYILLNLTPVRSGYVFKGYNFKADGSGDWVSNTTVFKNDSTIYAVWKQEITVTFKVGTSVLSSKKIGKGDKLGDFPVPYSDYLWNDFMGWFDGNNQYVSYTVVNKSITLTARKYERYEMDEYFQSLDAISQPDHLYIHYWRNDHNLSEEGTTNGGAPLYSTPIKSQTYSDWALWAWPYGITGGVGRTFNAAWIDRSGVVFDIDSKYTFSDCGWDSVKKEPDNYFGRFDTGAVGTQFFMLSSRQNQGFWTNDGGDRIVTFHYNNHVFFMQGDKEHPLLYDSATNEFNKW